MTFVGLAILAVVVLVLNLAHHAPPPDEEARVDAAPAESRIRGVAGPPPLWLILLMATVTAAGMIALVWYG